MKRLNFVWLFAMLLVVIGCGGGGAGSGTAGRGPVFITDNLDDHDHVWITLKKVVLTNASGDVVVFDDSVGKTIDLRSLRDASGERYSFLASAPSGTYTGMKVTVDKTVVLYTSGSTTGVSREFAGNNGSTALLTIAFSTPKTIGNGNGFALDFDLSNWNDDGTFITGNPFLGEGQGNGLGDPSRHEREDFTGTLQNLSGTPPNQTFNLVRGTHSIAVITTDQTVVFNSNGLPSPVLANGKRVEVRGSFSVAQNALIATSVKIEDNIGEEDEDEVEGSASSIDANAGTFVVTVHEAHHFIPTMADINVVTNGSTVFFSHGGITLTKAEFFAALVNGQEVEVEGSYDPNTNTLTAIKAKLEDGEGEGGNHEVEVTGPTSAVNAQLGTFDVTAQEWEGVNLGNNHLVHVVTNGSTEFEHGNMTAQQFFSALVGGQRVEVEGIFDANTRTLTATEAKLED
jgi:hypothetical protein